MERRSTFDFSPGFIRLLFWSFGILAASAQAWLLRFKFSADSISYLDMSDGVLAGGDWHQLINGTWSPLYPLLIGLTRRIFRISAAEEISAAHVLNVAVSFLRLLVSNFSCAASSVDSEKSRKIPTKAA